MYLYPKNAWLVVLYTDIRPPLCVIISRERNLSVSRWCVKSCTFGEGHSMVIVEPQCRNGKQEFRLPKSIADHPQGFAIQRTERTMSQWSTHQDLQEDHPGDLLLRNLWLTDLHQLPHSHNPIETSCLAVDVEETALSRYRRQCQQLSI